MTAQAAPDGLRLLSYTTAQVDPDNSTFYNRGRLHRGLGCKCPVDFELQLN